nr:peptidoglycan editing factor PgeF [uncultured Blautia sp.]
MELKWKTDLPQHMKINENKGVTYLTYPAFEKFPEFYHGFSTRLGGVSKGIYSSMNLSFTRGDEEEAVLENYRRIADAIGFSMEGIVCSDQTHTVHIRQVTEADKGKGVLQKKDYTDIDGLITNVPGITLTTFYADCVPLFFLDPVNKAAGLAHSGWRGTVGRMGEKMVKAMKDAFGSEPENLYAGIGPSICQDCYEVSADVADRFREEFQGYEEDAGLLYKTKPGKYQLNLWKANEIVLTEAGILREHISFPGICTCCNPEFLFSHRASQGKRGNLCAFLGVSVT